MNTDLSFFIFTDPESQDCASGVTPSGDVVFVVGCCWRIC